MNHGVDAYCRKRMGASLPYIAAVPPVFTDIAVVIPALNEFPLIQKTLFSLDAAAAFYRDECRARNEAPLLLSVIVTVNNKKSSPVGVKSNNAALFDFLQNEAPHLYKNIRLIALDCFSAGRELGEKEGVGMARKIGLDYAYRCCITMPSAIGDASAAPSMPLGNGDASAAPSMHSVTGDASSAPSMHSAKTMQPVLSDTSHKLLCFMDADTLVDKTYFSALASSFTLHQSNQKDPSATRSPNGTKHNAPFGLLHFRHQTAPDASQNDAIIRYEHDLKLHAQKLYDAQSPWYPVALGPTIVVTAKTYASCGGMNRRTAGEDFYFLQTLLKTAADFCIVPTTVHPSARISDRVIFGTGEAIDHALNGRPKQVVFPDAYYETLKTFLMMIKDKCNRAVIEQKPCTNDVLCDVKAISPILYDFLSDEGFFKVWETFFTQNKKSAARFETAFHCWFDALKTIRFFHALTNAQNRSCKDKAKD